MAYVCMGSNMGEPETNLARAREVLGSLPGWKIEASSPVYFTEPQDMRDQPWFANQVLKVSCALDMTAPDFLDMLLDVEKRLGRVRETSDPAMRFGPRVIDLDLLLFDQERWDTPHLALPHPRMSERAFVLVPLRDIEPPTDGLPERRCVPSLMPWKGTASASNGNAGVEPCGNG